MHLSFHFLQSSILFAANINSTINDTNKIRDIQSDSTKNKRYGMAQKDYISCVTMNGSESEIKEMVITHEAPNKNYKKQKHYLPEIEKDMNLDFKNSKIKTCINGENNYDSNEREEPSTKSEIEVRQLSNVEKRDSEINHVKTEEYHLEEKDETKEIVFFKSDEKGIHSQSNEKGETTMNSKMEALQDQINYFFNKEEQLINLRRNKQSKNQDLRMPSSSHDPEIVHIDNNLANNIGIPIIENKEILTKFLTINEQIETKIKEIPKVENELLRNNENKIKMPNFCNIVELFGKIMINDYLERIAKLKNDWVFTVYFFNEHDDFRKFIKKLHGKDFYATYNLNYKCLLKMNYNKKQVWNSETYNKHLIKPIIFYSEMVLNIEKINMIWNFVKRSSILREYFAEHAIIYISETDKSEEFMKNNKKGVTYFTFSEMELTKSENGLSYDAKIKSNDINNKKLTLKNNLYYFNYNYSMESLVLDLNTPVMNISLKSELPVNGIRQLKLKALNRIRKETYNFIFNFMNYELIDVKFKDSNNPIFYNPFSYHENLIENMFNSLAKIDNHPLSNLNILIYRHFYDEPLILSDYRVFMTPIKFFKSISDNYQSKLTSIFEIIKNCEDIEAFITLAQNISDESTKVITLLNNEMGKVAFTGKQKFENDIPDTDNFILTIKESYEGKINEFHIMFFDKKIYFLKSDHLIETENYLKIYRDVKKVIEGTFRN